MKEEDQLELYKTTTAWVYHFLSDLEQRLERSHVVQKMATVSEEKHDNRS